VQQVDAERHSVYVSVADGTRLAVYIYLPKSAKHATKVPTLYTATRYWRSSRDAPLNDNQKQWVASGFALVTLDVRGTGASFGQWYIPYSPQETKDIGFIAQWIAKQAWSNGKVVMTGVSYTGTTPLLALSDGSPVIKAIAPRFADFDMYADLLWPGGVTADSLIGKWGRAVRELDRNEPGGLTLVSRDSVRPVDGPDGDKLLAAAISEHELNPWSFDDAVNEVTFSDVSLKPAHGLTINDGSAYSHREQIEHSGAPMFGWGSWLDSGIAQGMLNRFMTFSNPQLSIIGAWSHGARANANPFNLDAPLAPSPAMRNQMIYCYLSHYVSSDRSTSNDRAIIYFTMGKNRWKKTSVWPVARSTYQLRYYLDSVRDLSIREPQTSGRDSYKVDFETDAGPDNRCGARCQSAVVLLFGQNVVLEGREPRDDRRSFQHRQEGQQVLGVYAHWRIMKPLVQACKLAQLFD
jgi:putative CocE/NonD family hydrolase